MLITENDCWLKYQVKLYVIWNRQCHRKTWDELQQTGFVRSRQVCVSACAYLYNMAAFLCIIFQIKACTICFRRVVWIRCVCVCVCSFPPWFLGKHSDVSAAPLLSAWSLISVTACWKLIHTHTHSVATISSLHSSVLPLFCIYMYARILHLDLFFLHPFVVHSVSSTLNSTPFKFL